MLIFNLVTDKHNETDLQILEPQIPVMDLDEYDESKRKSPVPFVKIKDEPKYEGYEDDGFEDVGTFEAHPVELLDDDGSGKSIVLFFFSFSI